ncbi:hypothetical protein [Microvirga subterranea]|uniref:Uncharacterized protein n=1 Tax=Microvirga subterranea TaxID=186651 RepID=A0A370HA27_9HYPH|nr:hypothetical protein [Microvirga subterranea]RDI51235.1 hypothetical protein DES45_11918 [Microvirga subterranea]
MSDRVRPRWTQSRWGVPVLGILLLFNLLLFVANQRDLLSILAALPQPVATLIAGIVGLGTIAWQTRRGFQNLIASQEHRATLDRDARIHQSELADEQAQRQTDRETKVLAASVHAELFALHRQVHNTIQSIVVQKHMYEKLLQAKSTSLFEYRFPRFRTTVFDENISKIGLLGPSIAGDVISVYATLRVELEPAVLKDAPADIMISLLEGLLETYRDLGGEIVHVGGRLSHVQFGNPDPGTLVDFRLKRDAAKARAK